MTEPTPIADLLAAYEDIRQRICGCYHHVDQHLADGCHAPACPCTTPAEKLTEALAAEGKSR
jgi:hypothetical protein